MTKLLRSSLSHYRAIGNLIHIRHFVAFFRCVEFESNAPDSSTFNGSRKFLVETQKTTLDLSLIRKPRNIFFHISLVFYVLPASQIQYQMFCKVDSKLKCFIYKFLKLLFYCVTQPLNIHHIKMQMKKIDLSTCLWRFIKSWNSLKLVWVLVNWLNPDYFVANFAFDLRRPYVLHAQSVCCTQISVY